MRHNKHGTEPDARRTFLMSFNWAGQSKGAERGAPSATSERAPKDNENHLGNYGKRGAKSGARLTLLWSSNRAGQSQRPHEGASSAGKEPKQDGCQTEPGAITGRAPGYSWRQIRTRAKLGRWTHLDLVAGPFLGPILRLQECTGNQIKVRHAEQAPKQDGH